MRRTAALRTIAESVFQVAVPAGTGDGSCQAGTAVNNAFVARIGGRPTSGGNEDCWLTFGNVALPSGITILEARLLVAYEENGSNETDAAADIYGSDTATPALPSDCDSTNTSEAGPSWSSITTANVEWEFSGFSAPGDGTIIQSPDIKTIVQELVDSYTYSGGSMQFQIRGKSGTNNFVRFYTFDHSTAPAPQLYIRYV